MNGSPKAAVCMGSDCGGAKTRPRPPDPIPIAELSECTRCATLVCGWCIAQCRPTHACEEASDGE